MALLYQDLYGGAKALAAPLPKESTGLPRRSFDLAPRAPHLASKAKAVIHLFMNGGPSQMDFFDPKPMLEKNHGEPYFDKMAGDSRVRTRLRDETQPIPFHPPRQSGTWVSERCPTWRSRWTMSAFVRSVTTHLTLSRPFS